MANVSKDIYEIALSKFLKESFKHGEKIAPVQLKNKKWIFINKSGEIVSKEYDGIGDYVTGFIRTSSGGFSVIKLNGKWGFINDTTYEEIKPEYDVVRGFDNGFARVKINGKWAFINKKGKRICDFKYESALNFEFDTKLATVKLNGKWGLINQQGQTICKHRYDRMFYVENKGYAVEQNGKWGLISESGRQIRRIKYDLQELETRYLHC